MATKKMTRKTSQYGAAASRNIEREMKAMEAGTLHSGGPDGPLVTDRKQAIAIALSETRKHGGKLPPDPTAKAAPEEPAAKKSAAGKASVKRS